MLLGLKNSRMQGVSGTASFSCGGRTNPKMVVGIPLLLMENLGVWSLGPGGGDPPPLKWSDLRYVFDIQEDCNGKEAIQA